MRISDTAEPSSMILDDNLKNDASYIFIVIPLIFSIYNLYSQKVIKTKCSKQRAYNVAYI